MVKSQCRIITLLVWALALMVLENRRQRRELIHYKQEKAQERAWEAEMMAESALFDQFVEETTPYDNPQNPSLSQEPDEGARRRHASREIQGAFVRSNFETWKSEKGSE
jgi:hypothetical protein